MPTDLAWLPRGHGLSEPDFEARHRLITVICALHVPALIVYALLVGRSFGVGLLAAAPVALAVAAAVAPGARLRRSLAACVGLLLSSAVLVYLSGGMIELHFHYFVAVAVVALYQEWLVYAVAIAFVLVEHGVLAQIDRSGVYNHSGNVWELAAVHAGFICALAVAQLCFWHYQERARAAEERLRRELYDGQQSLVAQLDDTARVRADLVGTVTHEFRTPLTGISAALLTLRRRRHQLGETTVDDLLDAALRHGERLRRLLENMLTAAEATAVDPDAVADVTVAAQEVLEGVAPEARERLVLDLPEALPAHISRSALHQVLANLLDNALAHSWPETPVHVSAGRIGSDAVVRVRNRGGELDAATAEHLLEPFTQGDASATRSREGVGLGLYVVRRLVEVHGGQLAVTSADGAVTVEVNLPAAVFPDSPASLTQESLTQESLPQQSVTRRGPSEASP